MQYEQITPAEVDTHLAAGTFRLGFVGMSNGGKSYRSRVLQDELDFYWYEVDAHIQAALGLKDMEDISDWLGYPTRDTYAEREREYLAAEETCTHLAELDTNGKNLVFDTTGSVIYLAQTTKEWLRNQCLVVNIDVGEEAVAAMSEQYFEDPKPVVWGANAFTCAPGESETDALRRSYPELLRYRLAEYRALAHITIPHAVLHDTSGEDTIRIINEYLST